MDECDDRPGLVVLVGAGAGEADLISVAGKKWISRAEIIVYDRLIDGQLLAAARPDARKVYVGKTAGPGRHDQQAINELLVELGREGRLVVRLKGGDPFIFGRGGEEAEVLAAAGVPFRVVPAVTAAIAAGAYAGIPLTDRRAATSVALVTGQRDPDRAGEEVNWSALAGMDTVVFYMGVGNLPMIAERLIAAGRCPDTPAAVVASAATPRQRTVTGTLAEIAELARAAGIAPPAVTIVGPTVALRERLNWYERLPLFGQTVLVTRPPHQAAALAERLAELGAGVIAAPVIEIRPPESFDEMDAALRSLSEFAMVAFTSVNGVRAFVDRCRAIGVDARALGGVKVAAIGAATAEALRDNFIAPDIVPTAFTTEALAEAVRAAGDLTGRGVLLPRADIATPHLPEALAAAGARVREVVAYRTMRPAELSAEALDALAAGGVNWITFTSSSAVRNFLTLLAEAKLAGKATGNLAGVDLAAIGPVTAETLGDHGLQPTVVAEEHTIEGLVRAMLRA